MYLSTFTSFSQYKPPYCFLTDSIASSIDSHIWRIIGEETRDFGNETEYCRAENK